MNISTSFQPVGSVALHGKLPRLIPPFLAVWCGQTEAKAAFADDKLLVALFCILINQFAKNGEAFGVPVVVQCLRFSLLWSSVFINHFFQ